MTIKNDVLLKKVLRRLLSTWKGDREGVIARVMEMFTHRKRKRKQMLVSRRITQELIEANGIFMLRASCCLSIDALLSRCFKQMALVSTTLLTGL